MHPFDTVPFSACFLQHSTAYWIRSIYCKQITRKFNSAFHPCGVGKSSTSLPDWGYGRAHYNNTTTNNKTFVERRSAVASEALAEQVS